MKILISLIYNSFKSSPFLYTEHLKVCFLGLEQYVLLDITSSKYNNELYPVERNNAYHKDPDKSPVNNPKTTPAIVVHLFIILLMASIINIESNANITT